MLYRYRGEAFVAPGSHLHMEAASLLLRAVAAACLAPVPTLESARLRKESGLPFARARGVLA